MPAQAFRNTLDLAQLAERLGYRRYWLAEHHNMPGIASAATAVLIGHVAGGTSTIRVGAGGIMLPNHAPLQVAEAVRHAGVAVSGADRSGPGPRAGHRPADREGVAPLFRQRRCVSAGRDGTARLFRAGRARPAGAGGAGRRHRRAGVAARLQPVQRDSWRRGWACRSRSPRTSRRTRWTRRWRCIDAISGRRRGCSSRTRCSA